MSSFSSFHILSYTVSPEISIVPTCGELITFLLSLSLKFKIKLFYAIKMAQLFPPFVMCFFTPYTCHILPYPFCVPLLLVYNVINLVHMFY